MEFTTATFGAILVIVAIVVVLIALFSKKTLKKTPLANPMIAIGAAVVLMGVGWYVGGVDEIQNWITPPAQYTPYVPTTPTTQTYESATFTITPVASHNSGFTITADSTVFKLPFALNQTHMVRESDNTTWNNPCMNFTITPVAWQGASSTDLVTVYYEYSDVDGMVSTDTGNYYFLTLSSGYRQARFTQKANTANYAFGSGSITTTLTTPVVLYLNLTVTNSSLCQSNAVLYGPALDHTPTITFHNADYTWTKTYTIDVFPTRIWESG